MNKKIYLIIQCVIFLAVIIITVAFYGSLPDPMASHWGLYGEVNGYMDKFWALAMSPLLILFMSVLSVVILKMDPLFKNIQKFEGYFYGFMTFLSVFFLVLHMFIIMWNLGYQVNIVYFISPLFSALMFFISILLKNSKRNWSIGIKTPWTLSSDEVWDKTHKLGAKLFIVVGIITLFGVLFPKVAFYLLFVPIIGVTIFLFVYSYLISAKIK